MSTASVDFEKLPLDQVLSFRINRLSAALGRQASVILEKESKLSLVEWRLLRLLADGQGAIARDLSRVSGMNPALISRGIRRLEGRQLIVTKRDENDRRTQRLTLTLKGQRLYEQTIPVMGRRHEALYASLSESEREQFASILDKLDTHAKILEFPELDAPRP